jgi:hypothetical protein
MPKPGQGGVLAVFHFRQTLKQQKQSTREEKKETRTRTKKGQTKKRANSLAQTE